MKTKTKRALMISSAVILTFLLCSSFLTQQTGNKYLTLKTFEAASEGDSYILLIDENGKIEQIPLAVFKMKTIAENSLKINEAFNKIAAKGYELITSTSNDAGVHITTYVFAKK